ncbi:Major facilitator superfamily domain general substrate transporter [Penicillium cf. griseofulvum]|nr:Major facilitator superfamily domain general substrate transporter [Penicillium cf. griseofulvum]
MTPSIEQQHDQQPDLVSTEKPSEVKVKEDETQLPTGTRLLAIIISILFAMFLVALDRTIIATAVPRIATQFNALDDISWYASAYLLTSCATQLSWGKVYTFYSTKAIFLIAILIFEVGSAVCGGSPQLQGLHLIIAQIVPLAKRPMYVGLMGSIFGLSSIIGPLMGGALTDNVTWRWCFYINLPIGGFTMVILFLFLAVPHKPQLCTWKQHIFRLDPLGSVLFLPSVICFLLALQWGGTTYSWSNGRIIALFVISGILIISFVGVQIRLKKGATVPPHIFKQRSIISGVIFSLCVGGGLISMLYTLPLWFQGVRGTSAVKSGIDTIPMVLALVLGTIISGGIITATGYYVPWMFVAAIFMSTGAGLMTTFKVDTNHAAWIGYQVLFGIGIGTGMQQPSMAAQTILPKDEVAIGVSLMFFAQSLGGAVFIAVAQSLFHNYLGANLSHIQGIDVAKILGTGATGLSNAVPATKLAEVLVLYNDGLRQSFIVAVAVSCLMIVPTLTMEWRSIKGKSSDTTS